MPHTTRSTWTCCAVTALLLTACSGNTPEELSACAPGDLATVVPGRLTLSTGAVTRAPWVAGGDLDEGTSGDPRTGEGYDAAVGFALAERLGFERDDVTWVGTPFPEAVAAGDKDFDVNVNQATILDDRAEAVDLTSPYYVVREAVVALAGGPLADARDLEDLSNVPLAVHQGSTAEDALRAALPDGAELLVDADPDEVRRAVSEGRAQALVTDLARAVELDADDTQLVDGELVGLLPPAPGAEELGLVLEKDSPLTACVDAALAALRDDGTLGELERRWFSEDTGWVLL